MRFVTAARQFRQLIENAELRRHELVRTVLPQLVELYAAGLGLQPITLEEVPDVDRSPQERPSVEWQSLYQQLNERIGPNACYWLVFDPTRTEESEREPVAGNLGDDFADIYLDVMSGLREWDGANESQEDEAVWQWQFLFSCHWGDHALNALKVLHRLEMDAAWKVPIRDPLP